MVTPSKHESGPGWIDCPGIARADIIHHLSLRRYYSAHIYLATLCSNYAGIIYQGLHILQKKNHWPGIYSSTESTSSCLNAQQLFLIQRSWVITSFIAMCLACMHISEENGVTNEAIVLEWLHGFKHLVRPQSCENRWGLITAQCKMLLFWTKIVVKSHAILN